MILKKYLTHILSGMITFVLLLIFMSLFMKPVQEGQAWIWGLYHEKASIISLGNMFNIDTKGLFSTENESLGTIEVTVAEANVRENPSVEEENVAFIATMGEQYEYYEKTKVDQIVWYKLIHPDTNDEYWISSKTVKKVDE